jgi:hypothetical protein
VKNESSVSADSRKIDMVADEYIINPVELDIFTDEAARREHIVQYSPKDSASRLITLEKSNYPNPCVYQ